MNNPKFPIIDVSEEGFLGDNIYPVLPTNSIEISIKNYEKHFHNSIYYDSEGNGFKVVGNEIFASKFLSRNKKLKLKFMQINKQIELEGLKKLVLEKGEDFYFIDEENINEFEKNVKESNNLRTLIILISGFIEEVFE